MPKTFLNIFDYYMKIGTFPNAWMRSKIVLIPKPVKPNDTKPKYRPVCLSDNIGKLFGKLICNRLKSEIDSKNGLFASQYGFRENK